MEPFTLPHFEKWAKRLILDNGDPWKLETFQRDFIEDVFAGSRECWLIVPEGNGKTTLIAGLGLYALRFSPDAQIPVAASSRDQAKIMYRQARGFLRQFPAREILGAMIARKREKACPLNVLHEPWLNGSVHVARRL